MHWIDLFAGSEGTLGVVIEARLKLLPARKPFWARWSFSPMTKRPLMPPTGSRFRRFRHFLPELVNETVRRNGTLKMGSDFAVPLACNREMLAFYKSCLQAEYPGRYVIFRHIGDAHVHVNIFSGDAAPLLERFARQAVALGGTVSAEHRLGKRKAGYLALQYAAADIEKMRAVKTSSIS